MLKNIRDASLSRFRTEIREGAGWFTLSTLLAPLTSLLLGPLILRKVGLEEYAVLALAGYFFILITTYYDFGTYPHLLTIFSKKLPERHADFGNTLVLRAALLASFFCALGLWAWWHPRTDVLHAFLAISMAGLVLPSPNIDWYLIANRRYFHFFLMRVAFSGVPVVLTLAWFFSPWKSLLLIAGINLVSAMTASLYVLLLLGPRKIGEGVACLRLVSLRGLRALASRVFPLALTQLLTPYFLAYALVWYTMVTPDKELVGAFGISYRIVIGFSALLGPLVLYVISRTGGTVRAVPFRQLFGVSIVATSGIGVLGILAVWFYFAISGVNPDFFPFAVRNFSILLAGIFFICLRIIHVSNCVMHGRYRAYFIIHLGACVPVLAFSWLTRNHLSGVWVPWLACLPDLLATAGFIFYSYLGSGRKVLAPGRSGGAT